MITTKVLGYLSALLLILFLAALVFGFYERSQAIKYAAATQTYQQANASNVKAIAALQKTNNATADALAASQQRQAIAVKEVSEANTAATKALNRRTTARQVIYAKDATAKSWANTVVPTDVAVGLCRGTCD